MKKQTFFGSMVLVFIFCLFGQVASSQVSTPAVPYLQTSIDL